MFQHHGKDAVDEEVAEQKKFQNLLKKYVEPMNRQEGDKLPVSTFVKHGMEDGTFMAWYCCI